MLGTLQDLEQHKTYANARLLWAIGQQQGAQRDRQLRELLHHTLLTNRLCLRLSRTVPYSLEPDSQAREARAAVIAQYQETHAEQTSWLAQLEEADLDQTLEKPYISGRGFSVAERLDRGMPCTAPGTAAPAPGARASWAERRLGWIAFHG